LNGGIFVDLRDLRISRFLKEGGEKNGKVIKIFEG